MEADKTISVSTQEMVNDVESPLQIKERYVDRNVGNDTSDIFLPNKKYDELILIKKKLNWIGYSGIEKTPLFGSYLGEKIKELQGDYQLPVTGIIDRETMWKINELFANMYQKGSVHQNIWSFKETLKKLGFGDYEATDDIFDEYTVTQIRALQSFYNLPVSGEICDATLGKIHEILSSPFQLNKRHNKTIDLKRNLNILGYGPIKPTSKFGKLTENKLKLFQAEHELPCSGIADDITLNKLNDLLKFSEKNTYVEYEIPLAELINVQKKEIKNQLDEDEKMFIGDPIKYLKDPKNKFLFLDLTKSHIAKATVLESYLMDKQLLAGQAQTFIDAGTEHGINEALLILEVLSGIEREDTSRLVTGVPVDCDGNVTYIEDVENQTYSPGDTKYTDAYVYNPYAHMYNTIRDAVIDAINNGWYSLEKAIVEGAAMVRDHYITYEQNTFYNKIWNPAKMVKLRRVKRRLKDTDVSWILRHRDLLYDLYQSLDSYTLYLEIPVYKGRK